jgi:hypothetical protein
MGVRFHNVTLGIRYQKCPYRAASLPVQFLLFCKPSCELKNCDENLCVISANSTIVIGCCYSIGVFQEQIHYCEYIVSFPYKIRYNTIKDVRLGNPVDDKTTHTVLFVLLPTCFSYLLSLNDNTSDIAMTCPQLNESRLNFNSVCIANAIGRVSYHNLP